MKYFDVCFGRSRTPTVELAIAIRLLIDRPCYIQADQDE